ncbi:MAG: prepilin peptidase [Bdellovibrionales bacterium]
MAPETLLPILQIVTVSFVGLAFGSFATALIYRVPRGQSWASVKKEDKTHRSACPSCQKQLTAWDLIPLFSWLILKGRCRNCKTPIPIFYPCTEILTLLACLAAYVIYGFSPQAALIIMLAPILTALLIIDIQHMILPNQLVLIAFILGLVFHGLNIYTGAAPLEAAMIYGGGAIVFAVFAWGLGALMTKILKKDALGFGDVKFFAVVGLWLGAPSLGWFCMLSGILGVVLALLWEKLFKQKQFPFGPALIASFYGLLLLHGSHF